MISIYLSKYHYDAALIDMKIFKLLTVQRHNEETIAG
jgi:hypothetical protein